MINSTVTVGDLVTILKNIEVIEMFRPGCGGPDHIREALASLTDEQIGKLFRAIDQVCFGAKVLSNAVVQIKRDV